MATKAAKYGFAGVLAMFSLMAQMGCEKDDDNLVVNVVEKGDAEETSANGSAEINMNGDYAKWHYFDFATGKFKSQPVEDKEPQSWDIAFHRFDVKTNGLKVCKTDKKNLADVVSVVDADFVSDTEGDSIAVDMTNMMAGEVGYAKTRLNHAMTSFVTYSLVTMPPTYTFNDVVYVVRLNDGKDVKLKFTDYKKNGETAYITFDYEYIK